MSKGQPDYLFSVGKVVAKTKNTTFDQCNEYVDDWYVKIQEWWKSFEELGEAIFYGIISSKDKFRIKKVLLLEQKKNVRSIPGITKKHGKFRYTSGFL